MLESNLLGQVSVTRISWKGDFGTGAFEKLWGEYNKDIRSWESLKTVLLGEVKRNEWTKGE